MDENTTEDEHDLCVTLHFTRADSSFTKTNFRVGFEVVESQKLHDLWHGCGYSSEGINFLKSEVVDALTATIRQEGAAGPALQSLLIPSPAVRISRG